MDGKEERFPVGLYRSTSIAAKVNRIVQERDSGPRLEARKEEKGRRKVARVTREFAGVAETWTHRGALRQGELEQESERCGRSQR